MFPINDTEPNRYTPFASMTLALIAVNTLLLFLGPAITWESLMRYGFTPRLVLHREGAGMLSGITAMFFHAGFFHLFGNMFALWVFGRRVEDACGPWRFLLFYLLAGACADIVTLLVHYDSLIPTIGASGAIFGVMGAYLLLYPQGRIRTLIILKIIPVWPKLRAVWVVLYFLGVQIIPAVEIALHGEDYQVAYWAHLGGFIAAIFTPLFLRSEAFARYLSNVDV